MEKKKERDHMIDVDVDADVDSTTNQQQNIVQKRDEDKTMKVVKDIMYNYRTSRGR